MAQWILRTRIRYSTRKDGQATFSEHLLFGDPPPSSERETGTDHTNGGREGGRRRDFGLGRAWNVIYGWLPAWPGGPSVGPHSLYQYGGITD